jgi:hypothetical protein
MACLPAKRQREIGAGDTRRRLGAKGEIPVECDLDSIARYTPKLGTNPGPQRQQAPVQLDRSGNPQGQFGNRVQCGQLYRTQHVDSSAASFLTQPHVHRGILQVERELLLSHMNHQAGERRVLGGNSAAPRPGGLGALGLWRRFLPWWGRLRPKAGSGLPRNRGRSLRAGIEPQGDRGRANGRREPTSGVCTSLVENCRRLPPWPEYSSS